MKSKPVNEFVSLNFDEQRALMALKDLHGESNKDVLAAITTDMVNYGISNPLLYPINSRASILDDFQFLVEQELRALHSEEFSGSKNLSPVQFAAIKQLKDNFNFVVRQFDTEGTVVVLDKDLYSYQVMQILNQGDTYRKLPSEPTHSFKGSLLVLLDERWLWGS